MPQSGNDSSLFGAWPGGLLIALLVGVGAVGWVQTPFKPERPTEPREGLGLVGVQDADARLWQDPFAAVVEARKGRQQTKVSEPECRSVEIAPDGRTLLMGRDCPRGDGAGGATAAGAEHHGLDELRGQIHSRIATLSQEWKGVPGASPVTVLGIMVSASPFPGAAENRRRYRYATLSALMLEEFLPDDAEHVGYADLPKGASPQFVPYEWFTRAPLSPADAGSRALLLLWLDDDSLGAPAQHDGNPGSPRNAEKPVPLARLTALLTSIVPEAGVNFQVIGPAGSGTLEAMADEYRDRLSARPTKDPGDRVARIWSPFATIPGPFADPIGPQRPVCPDDTQDTCVAIRIPTPVERTIAFDDALAKMLVAELGRRHIAGNSGIALVGQWDTAYSRRLAKLVEEAWYDSQQRQRTVGDRTTRDQREDRDKRIVRYSYMRGLDGRIPGAKPKDQGDGDAKSIERPSGEDQIDYLRRIRDALLAEDARRRQGCSWDDRTRQQCGIRAIGVLGNDYFDKLLVLQALKPVFPNAVFFTTDLYADMLHPQDNAFTRNLIVASGFGLTLAQDWQREVPPLRDSYQTALLLAVRLAVQDTLDIEQQVQTPPPPRLFEIGRTRAVELITSPQRDTKGQLRRPGLTPGKEDPHPAADLEEHYSLQQAGGHWVQAAAPPFALALALGLGLAALGPQRGWAAVRRWWQGLRGDWLNSAIAAFSLAVTVLLLGLLALDLHQGGEPFTLIEGVSVWPSEILRLAAGLLAVGLLIHGHRRQREAREGITRDFPGLGAVGTGGEAPGPAVEHPCAALLDQGEAVRTPAAELWVRFARRCGLRQTLRRVWPEILGFLVLAFSLMLMLGFPNRPTRSELSWVLDSAIILLVLIPFLALLFFMVDATRQTLALARDLEGPVSWPAQTLRSLGLEAWIAEHAGQPAGADIVWLDVRLIAAVTRPVGNLVWYPVVVLMLIALARHPLFDAWSLPPALLLVMALAIAYAVGCAWTLRRAAEGVREAAVRDLKSAIWRAQGCPDGRECLEALRTMLEEILATRDGAFRPFSQQPVVQALLTLVSSVSGLALLEYSSMANL